MALITVNLKIVSPYGTEDVPTPVSSGSVTFTPIGHGKYGDSLRSIETKIVPIIGGELTNQVDGEIIPLELTPGAWKVLVSPKLGPAWPEMQFTLTEGMPEPVNLAVLAPEVSIDAKQLAKGNDGVGISRVSDIDSDGYSVITYTDGTTDSIKFPVQYGDPSEGGQGTGIDRIEGNTTEMTVYLEDGTSYTIPLHRGEDGTGIDSISAAPDNNTITVLLTDGTSTEISLPIGEIGPMNLSDLEDVDISSIEVGHTIQWDGSRWVSGTLGTGGGPATPVSIDDLTDVDTTGVDIGQVLSWNGTNWVGQDLSSGNGPGEGTLSDTVKNIIVSEDPNIELNEGDLLLVTDNDFRLEVVTATEQVIAPNNRSLSITVPNEVQEGDLLLAMVGSSVGSQISIPGFSVVERAAGPATNTTAGANTSTVLSGFSVAGSTVTATSTVSGRMFLSIIVFRAREGTPQVLSSKSKSYTAKSYTDGGGEASINHPIPDELSSHRSIAVVVTTCALNLTDRAQTVVWPVGWTPETPHYQEGLSVDEVARSWVAWKSLVPGEELTSSYVRHSSSSGHDGATVLVLVGAV